MTARELIKEFLTGRRDSISTSILHDHIESFGYRRVSSCGALSKMVSRGEVISEGHHVNTFVKLNEFYRPSVASVRQIDNHAHLGGVKRVVTAKPKQKRVNGIFDLCRQHSRIYALIDQPIREVRP